MFPRHVLNKLRKYLHLATEGFTLIFKNMEDYFAFKSRFEDFVRTDI